MTLDPSYALQTALRARLVAFSALTALVPASAIHDTWRRPEAASSIIMGDGQTILDDRFIARNMVRVALDLHAWTKGADLARTKIITGAIGAALAGQMPSLDGAACVDFRITHTRFMRDPSNEWGHAVVSVEALVDTLSSGAMTSPSAAPSPSTVVDLAFTFKNEEVWTIKHNLNRYPPIVAMDTAGEEIGGDLVYLDANTVQITYGIPVSGKAYVS